MSVDTSSIFYQMGQAVKAASGGVSKSDDYSEPAFSNGVLQSITTWTDDGKGTKVGSKTFSYTSGNLTSVVEKDGSDITTLTKTLTYDGDGNLASITKDYA
jgi:YD repeat-containing protein